MNSGIYKIANKITGDFYIGSAINLKNRFYRHNTTLNLNKHQNRHLQNAYNKYGKHAFEFVIIELVPNKNSLIKREQFYIDKLNPIYNICKIANSSLGIKRTEDTKHKLSLAKKGNKNALGAVRSEKTKQQISNSCKKLKNALGHKHTIESKRKISENNSKYWKNKNRSEDTKLKISKSKKGKKLSEGAIYKISKPFKLLSPEGSIIEGRNIRKFCRENNLKPSNICAVIKNKRKSHKGWTKPISKE